MNHGTTATNVDNVYSQYTIACIHSHPLGQSPVPSPLDLHFTVNAVKDSFAPNYRATYIYNSTMSMGYALYVEDRAKAAEFYVDYGGQFDENTNGFVVGSELDLYANSLSFESSFTPEDTEAFLLAAVLNRFDTGIKL
jgi:hypothetical protein